MMYSKFRIDWMKGLVMALLLSVVAGTAACTAGSKQAAPSGTVPEGSPVSPTAGVSVAATGLPPTVAGPNPGETVSAPPSLVPSPTPQGPPTLPLPTASPQPQPATPTAAPTLAASPTAQIAPTSTATAAPTAQPAPPPAPAPSVSAPSAGSPQEAFIRQVAPWAEAEQADSGAPASFSIALAGTETSWGVSPLMKQYNNYHMISCSQPSEGLPCVRYGNGMWNQYSSPEQAFLWHGRWLRARSAFAEAFKHTDDVAAFTRLVATCYVNCAGPFPQAFYDAIMRTVDQYNLRQYDSAHPPASQ